MTEPRSPAKAFSLESEERELIRSLIIAEPDIVLGDDDVMRRLIGESTGAGRKVVDLRDRLVERLEQRLDRMVETHRTVIAAAYENVSGTAQLHRAILSLIEPPDLSSFLARLTHEVPISLGIDDCRLCIEAEVPESFPAKPFGRGLGERVLAVSEGWCDSYIMISGTPSPEGILLREAGADAEMIFGEANPVQSEAVMLLDVAGTPGVLVFGASDPGKFAPDQGTDLLKFFAGVVERLLIQRLAEADFG